MTLFVFLSNRFSAPAAHCSMVVCPKRLISSISSASIPSAVFTAPCSLSLKIKDRFKALAKRWATPQALDHLGFLLGQ